MRHVKVLLLVGFLGLSAGCTLGPPLLGSLVKEPTPEAEAPPAPELPPGKAAQACLTTARACASKGYVREAIQEYRMARQINPDLPEVAWRLAVLYDQQGDFDRAEIEYRQALAVQPNNTELLNDMGYYHYRRGQPAEAEKYLRQALELNPGQKPAWGNLGMARRPGPGQRELRGVRSRGPAGPGPRQRRHPAGPCRSGGTGTPATAAGPGPGAELAASPGRAGPAGQEAGPERPFSGGRIPDRFHHPLSRPRSQIQAVIPIRWSRGVYSKCHKRPG